MRSSSNGRKFVDEESDKSQEKYGRATCCKILEAMLTLNKLWSCVGLHHLCHEEKGLRGIRWEAEKSVRRLLLEFK